MTRDSVGSAFGDAPASALPMFTRFALGLARGRRIGKEWPLKYTRFRGIGQELLFLWVLEQVEVYWRAGNQGGKTFGGAMLGVAIAMGMKVLDGLPVPKCQTPNIGYVLTQTYKQQSTSTQQAYLNLIGDWPHEIGWVDKKNNYISTIWVKPIGCESDDYREWSRIIFHCAQTGNSLPGGRIDWAHADEPPDMQMWREIRSRRTANRPFYKWITATPLDRNDWDELERDFEGCESVPKNGRVQLITTIYQNEALSPEHLAAQLSDWEGDPYLDARVNGGLVDLSGKCPFNTAKLGRWMRTRTFDPKEETIEVLEERDLPDGRYQSGASALVKVYWGPEPDEEYLMVLDPAAGIKDPYHDPSCLHIYGRRRRRLVLTYNDYLSSYGLGYLACILGWRYNNAICDIDMTGGYGDSCLRAMSERNYGNFTLELIEERAKDAPETFRIGFKSTFQKRNALIGDIQRAIDKDTIHIPSREVISCLLNMTFDGETGKIAAVKGRHDEHGLNLGLALVDMENLPTITYTKYKSDSFVQRVNADLGRPAITQRVLPPQERVVVRPRSRKWNAPAPSRRRNFGT